MGDAEPTVNHRHRPISPQTVRFFHWISFIEPFLLQTRAFVHSGFMPSSNDIPAERRLGSIQVLVCGQLGGQDDAIPQMDAAVKVMNSAEKTSRIPIAKTIFSSVSLLLVTIRHSTIKNTIYNELALLCVDACKVLHRGTDGKNLDELSRPMREALDTLSETVELVRRKVTLLAAERPPRRSSGLSSGTSQAPRWKSNLNEVLLVFNTELVIHARDTPADLHRNSLLTAAAAGNTEQASSLPHMKGSQQPPLYVEAKSEGEDSQAEKVDGTVVAVTKPKQTTLLSQVENGLRTPMHVVAMSEGEEPRVENFDGIPASGEQASVVEPLKRAASLPRTKDDRRLSIHIETMSEGADETKHLEGNQPSEDPETAYTPLEQLPELPAYNPQPCHSNKPVVDSTGEPVAATTLDSVVTDHLPERPVKQLQLDADLVRNADRPPQPLLSREATSTQGDDLLLTVYPATSSSNLIDLDIPACKRLISGASHPHEVISLIKAIYASNDELKMIRDLCRDDAQVFIDVVHKALDHPDLQLSLRTKCLSTLCWVCGRHALLPRSLQIPLCYNRLDTPLYGGGFADVWKGEYQDRPVAVKVLRMYSTSDPVKVTSRFCKEVVTWKALCHPNLLSLLGITMGDGRFAMVSEWMENGNINEFVKAHKDANRFKLFGDVSRGLIYMHGQKMIHGDLKGANILIDKNCHARLADFGLLTIILDPKIFTASSSIATCGTIRWMSPERLDPTRFNLKNGRPTKESDCYAFGMVIHEVLSGKAPFAESTDYIIMRKVIEGERPEKPEGAQGLWFTDDLWEMLKQCWAAQRESRPSIEAVLECLEQITETWKPPPQQTNEDAEADEDDWDYFT